jgi:3-dehydroquinate dehydratase II
MKLAIVNGPNLNLLGHREPQHYGILTYEQLISQVNAYAEQYHISLTWFQSNHEGALLDYLQQLPGQVDGIIINGGAYTHTSIALLDCLLAIKLPCVEVHLSDLSQREAFRQHSYLREACEATFQGQQIKSYYQAIDYFNQRRL